MPALKDLLYLAPLLILATAPVIMMLTITVSRNLRVVFGFSLFMYLAAFVSLFAVSGNMPKSYFSLLIMDNFGVLMMGILFVVCFLITVISYLYLSQHSGEQEEYFIMLFVASFGACVMVTANHFIAFFLGLETLSISLYVLISYLRHRDRGVEAGVKFLVMASLSTAFLLFGMALVYAGTATMSFTGLSSYFAAGKPPVMVITGLGMMFTGIGFKLALVPFHMWAPDVYQGAPAPVTIFIATISKGSVMAVAIRLLYAIRAFESPAIFQLISILAIVSMFAGNLLALKQRNLKRLLAYSSIAHLGYLMITLLAGSTLALQAALFYLASYMITTVGAFGVISLLSVCDLEAEDIENFRGLFWKNPWIAIVLTLVLLSLAGIPLTAGFIGKFYLVFAGIKSSLWALVISLIASSVISIYYYLRVIRIMLAENEDNTVMELSFTGNVILAVVAIGILLLGIIPPFLTNIIDRFSLLI
jgi:NADH-quinone oxidoreductase subunit N